MLFQSCSIACFCLGGRVDLDTAKSSAARIARVRLRVGLSQPVRRGRADGGVQAGHVAAVLPYGGFRAPGPFGN